MVKTPKDIKRIPLDLIKIDPFKNIRDPNTIESLDSDFMRQDLKLRGQQTVAVLNKIGDHYEPIQGNRRTFNLQKLRDEGAIDPLTNKVFDSINAIVYDNISEEDRVILMVDVGQTRTLSKYELQYAFDKLFAVRYNEKEIVVLLHDLIAMHYPPSRKIKPVTEDGGVDLLNYYRGIVQTAKRAYFSPTILHDAWIAKMKGDQNWPNKTEMEELSAIHVKEMESDPTGTKYSRDNPGPLFLAGWAKLQEAVAKGRATGNKPKPISMANRQQVEDTLKVCESMIVKATLAIQLRKVSPERMTIVDKIATQLEKGEITPEQFKSAIAEAVKSE